MNILLIESSSKKIEFGYAVNDEIVVLKELDSENNADSLIYMIKEIFDEKHIDFKDIDVVSLSNGPGSFTGLRIGSAIAKGICFALKCKLLEISTLDIIANKCKDLKDGEVFTSLVFSNSKSMEFYSADYIYENKELKRVSEYSTGILDISGNKKYIINEKNEFDFPAGSDIINVSGFSNIRSQYELSLKYIGEDKFADYRLSEPFYMKTFVPLKPVKK
jgi:tRNA threonylcarbamoyladenosine biosynthesis protein TsaB